jgi:hypothetical protein
LREDLAGPLASVETAMVPFSDDQPVVYPDAERALV